MIPNKHIILLSLILLCSFLYLYNIGARDFWAPDEGDFAQIVKELDNNYIVLHLNNTPYGEKPPLFYYMAKLSSRIFSSLKDEISLRIPSAIFAMGGILFFFLTIKNFFNQSVAIISSSILLSSPLYYWQARYLQVDMVFSVLVSCSLLCFFWFHNNKKKVFFYLHVISMALAFLTKGPVAILLIIPIIIIYLVLQKNIRLLFHKETAIGIFIFIAITIPWYLLVYFREGFPYLYENIVRQNLTRFFEAWSHKRAFYYYFTTLPLDFFPWSIFLPMGIYITFTEYKKNHPVLYFLIWFVWMFLFFSLSSGKISKYMLPLLPSIALISTFPFFKEKSQYNRYVLFVFIAVLFILSGLLFFFKLSQHREFFLERIIAGILCLATGVLVYIFLRKDAIKKAFITIFIFMFFLYGIGNTSVYAKWNEYKSPRFLCEKIKTYIAQGAPWIFYGSMRGVYIYYTGSFAIHIDEHNVQRLKEMKDRLGTFFILTRNRDIDEINNAIGKVHILLKEKVGDTVMVFCHYVKAN